MKIITAAIAIQWESCMLGLNTYSLKTSSSCVRLPDLRRCRSLIPAYASYGYCCCVETCCWTISQRSSTRRQIIVITPTAWSDSRSIIHCPETIAMLAVRAETSMSLIEIPLSPRPRSWNSEAMSSHDRVTCPLNPMTNSSDC